MRRRLFLPWHGFSVHSYNVPLPLPGVYLVTDLTNGRQYVGASKNIEARFVYGWRQAPASLLLGIRMREVGFSNFLVEPIYYSFEGALDAIECDLITAYDCITPHGYNAVLSGGPAGTFRAIGADAILEAKRTAGIIAYARSAEAQRRFKEQWNDKAIKERSTNSRLASSVWRDYINSEVNVERLVEAGKAMHADPEIERRRIANTTRAWQDEGLREQQRQRRVAYLADPAHSKAHTEQVKKAQVAATEASAVKVKGSIWITNGASNKRWPKDQPLPQSWGYGRTLTKPTGPKPGTLTWIHNGEIERQFLQGQSIPEGWQQGRLPGKSGRKKGTVAPFTWITDGVDEQHLSHGAKIPRGWRRGRLPVSDETIAKQRQTLKTTLGEHPEIQNKISESVRAKFADPEYRARYDAGRLQVGPKISAKLKDYYASEEGRAQLAGKSGRASEQMLKQWRENPLIWITDGVVGKRIRADQLIPSGWYRGKPDKRRSS